MGRKLSRKPKLGKEMTRQELADFVRESEDYPDDAKIRVRASWKGGIQEIEIDDEDLVKPTDSARFRQS